MIRLDQIKLLEGKVNRAVEQIRLLRDENKALKRTVEKSQARMGELEGLVARFKSDQEEIEQGILRALKNLDKLEDEVGSRARKDSAAAQGPTPTPAPEEPPVERASEPVVDTSGNDEPESTPGEQLDIF
jgi:septal ring factor EnvC (AmiA/AmiB activator)